MFPKHSRQPGRRGVRPARLSLMVAAILVLACLTSHDVHAAGTPAGSIISNAATVTYTSTGLTYTKNSNLNTLVVDDKLSFILTAADTGNVTITSSGRACMTYILTNTGNAPHDYTLTAAVTGTPEFTPASAPGFYSDAAGTIPLPTDSNTGGLPYVSNLAPDTSITVYLFITAPPQLTEGQRVFYLVTAESYQPVNLGAVNPPVKSSTQAAADALVNKNTNLMTRFIVLADAHGNGGDADKDGTYALIAKDGANNTIGFRAHSIAVNIVKTLTVSDKAGGTQPVSGATIRYTLSVTATGAGTAADVVITDPVPANSTYTAGTLMLNGTPLSDASDSDAGDMGGSTPGTVTVKLGNLTSASPAQLITFDVKIN